MLSFEVVNVRVDDQVGYTSYSLTGFERHMATGGFELVSMHSRNDCLYAHLRSKASRLRTKHMLHDTPQVCPACGRPM